MRLTVEEKIEALKRAWKEVFEVDHVDDDADFFDEGGDSIKAVQLSSWLIQKGLKLDLGMVFSTPVLSEMAETMEETDPMSVPDQLMTKELMQKKYEELTGQGTPAMPAGAPSAGIPSGASVPSAAMPSDAGQDQQLCDPANNPQAAPQNQGQDQQLCDPANNPQAAPQSQGQDQQLCDPANNPQAAPQNQGQDQQLCDPANTPQMNAPQGWSAYAAPMNVPAQNAFPQNNQMLYLTQMMLSQQQTMLQMMQLLLTMMSQPMAPSMPQQHMGPVMAPPTMQPMQPPMPFMAGNASVNQQAPSLTPQQQAAMQQYVDQHRSHKVDKPIENPNVIRIEKAKAGKPEKSAEEVLEYVLSTLLKNGFDKSIDLFEQGLTSLDTMKMITRCGEYGYNLKMQDIYMHSVFSELVECMTPGE